MSYLVLSFLCFILTRSFLAFSWNNNLAQWAREEVYKAKTPEEVILAGDTFITWNIISAIINPLHFNKWTSRLWYEYQKRKCQYDHA